MKSNNSQGNPYHDESGKFTSGDGVSAGKGNKSISDILKEYGYDVYDPLASFAPKKQDDYEQKMSKMGFGPDVKDTVVITNKKNPMFRHVIDRDKLANVGSDWQVYDSENAISDAESDANHIFIGRLANLFTDQLGSFSEFSDSAKIDVDKLENYIKNVPIVDKNSDRIKIVLTDYLINGDEISEIAKKYGANDDMIKRYLAKGVKALSPRIGKDLDQFMTTPAKEKNKQERDKFESYIK